ncbi:cysteine desulfurase family protein [Synechococcus sp. NOUM97013]|uniref:cysteine desulfurase family protein n=1 Tax=Synechococcus sp. NOUM97013 TaxID=1442555 RepID=UPI0016493E83|nr:cysteine desulfurase family protein [Synechococcus sp. NOUM97013]QNI74728.1 cysteine desulfurase [Synechococcus sp. NOUM97013]
MLPTPAEGSLNNGVINLDHQATTPCHPAVIEAMEPWWREQWGNASSRQHRLGLTAAAAVSSARNTLADSLGVESDEVIFTSGATEANNLALLGHARFRARTAGGPGHLISVASEHHAVLDPLQQLRQEGFELTLLTPRPDGLIETTQLEQAIQPNTQLVSVMVANNEIGVIQPVQELSTICRNHGITMHTDAAQAYGHLPVNMQHLGCSLLSVSAHKFNGPKGIGALVARKGTGLDPLFWGGGQEQGLRPGTLPVPLIVGLAAAATLAKADQAARLTRLGALRDQLWHDLKQRNPGLLLNGTLHPRLAHNLNITVPGISGSRLQRALKSQLACSSGSACSSGAPSHVLRAIGRSRTEAEASLRLSLGRDTTAIDIERAVAVLTETIQAGATGRP